MTMDDIVVLHWTPRMGLLSKEDTQLQDYKHYFEILQNEYSLDILHHYPKQDISVRITPYISLY